jgi:hypothetical protein
VKIAGPGLAKLSDRSRKMVFIGYESGTKGYILFDPATSKLAVSRDVIFEENVPWVWDRSMCNTNHSVTDNFIVHYESADQNPTIEETQDSAVSPGAGSAGMNSASQGSGVGHDEAPNSPHTPIHSAASNQGGATPSDHDSGNSNGAPQRFRTLTDLLDSTYEVLDYEYSGVCMLAANEPVSVEEALEQPCWKRAMQDEIIQSTRTRPGKSQNCQVDAKL